MLNIPSQLNDLDDPIRVGVIGAGLFGTKLVDQIERVPGMTTAAIADINTETAHDTFREAGVSASDVSEVDDAAAIDAAIADGKRALTDDSFELIKSDDVDVVVEATGLPEIGAEHAYKAIMNDKHVVMVTVEADTVAGPILAQLAENNGVTYTMAYGDQPALLVEMYDWAQAVGLDVVAAGKGNPFVEEYRHGTPDDVFERWGFDEEFVEEANLNPRMYNSFLDGTKVAVEMCAVANATGLTPDVPGMHLPAAEIPEIPETFRPEEEGGILENTGVIDTVSSLYPDGSEVDFDVEFGIFIVTTTPNEEVQQYLEEMGGSGLYTASDGKYQVFYRPYHLPGTETPISIANAALENKPTGVPRDRIGEVVGGAKKDLEPGDTIDGGGGYTVYGYLEEAEYADEQNHVPFELLDGATVTSEVAQDDILTYDDVELPEDSFLLKLRDLQDAL